jgi:hypothetical protein
MCGFGKQWVDGQLLVCLESPFLKVAVAPGVGGRIVSLVDKATGHEFLWRNAALKLERLPPGSEYDPNFYGGIDELLPNDIPETINGVKCPDHGELWTAALAWEAQPDQLVLRGALPLFGLTYERTLRLRPDAPVLELAYRIANPTPEPRTFLWKLHAALALQPGDVIECPARQARVADPAWSRFQSVKPFAWPVLEGQAVNVAPPPEGAMDFFYLYQLEAGRIGWRRPRAGLRFGYEFDTRVFPFAWLFASYGGFDGHYTAILEPCTAMPISVNKAAALNQCARLAPGAALQTQVTIHAGTF